MFQIILRLIPFTSFPNYLSVIYLRLVARLSEMLEAKKSRTKKEDIMIIHLCLVNEFLVRGVEFDFESAEHFY